MKRSIIATTLALCVGCATGVAIRDLVVPARAQGQTGPSYEYDVVNANIFRVEERKQVLARYGREGWRLVTATRAHSAGFDHDMLYFERQLPR